MGDLYIKVESEVNGMVEIVEIVKVIETETDYYQVGSAHRIFVPGFVAYSFTPEELLYAVNFGTVVFKRSPEQRLILTVVDAAYGIEFMQKYGKKI